MFRTFDLEFYRIYLLFIVEISEITKKRIPKYLKMYTYTKKQEY